jgi:hypothetical protein
VDRLLLLALSHATCLARLATPPPSCPFVSALAVELGRCGLAFESLTLAAPCMRRMDG